MIPTSTFGSVLSRRVYNVVWVVFGVALPLSCLLVTGSKLVRALQAQRRQNEVAAAGHARHQQQCYGRVSVCPSVTSAAVLAVLAGDDDRRRYSGLVCRPRLSINRGRVSGPDRRRRDSVRPTAGRLSDRHRAAQPLSDDQVRRQLRVLRACASRLRSTRHWC